MLKYPENVYFIDKDEIRELAKLDNAQVGNVVRRLHKECFMIFSDDELKSVIFHYINGENELTGRGIRIDFNSEYFYDELLLFSTYIYKEFERNDPVGIYITYTEYLRDILEQNDYLTTTSDELKEQKKLYGSGFIMAKQKIEVIKSISREEFYEGLLKPNNIEIIENKTYLYLMLNKDTNFFKIGYSKNPIFREKTLQSTEPNIFTIKFWQCDKNVETEMHRLFKNKRVRGEWFKLNIDDLIKLNTEMKNYS